MNRKRYLRVYILIAFIFLMYNIATVPFSRSIIFWIAYFFSVLAILVQIYTLRELLKNQAPVRDRLYDFPIFRISILYLIVQIIVGLLLMGFADKVPVFAAALVETGILAAAVMALYAAGSARAEAFRQDVLLRNGLEKIEELQTRVNLLTGQCDKEEVKETLSRLAEEIRYSNPLSREATEEIEEEITVLFTEVEAAALDGDIENTAGLCERMTGLLRERDRICKYRR